MRPRNLAVGFLLLAAAAAFLPLVLGPYGLSVALTLCMWIALTQSWSLFCGLTGYISLGHVVFYGLGAYLSVVAWQALPLWLVVPLAGLAAGLFALVIGAPVLRVRGPYFVILTFGIAELVKHLVVNLEAGLGKASRLLFGTPSIAALFWAMLGLCLLASLLAVFLRRSRFAKGLIAIREDEEAAATIGIPVTRFKTLAYALSAVIPGMVGALMVLRSTYFEALQVFNPVISFSIVTMAIIGGSDDARGPLLGAAFLMALSEVLWANAPQLYLVILGLLLVGFVLLLPNGLVGLAARFSRPAP
jgi:branched-chain amino acid transport system permease protein